MKNAGVFVVGGKGQGQWRKIARFEGPRTWWIAPGT